MKVCNTQRCNIEVLSKDKKMEDARIKFGKYIEKSVALEESNYGDER
ncbi:hypothetical protein [Mediterraneibacter faecis]|nr:hypothetical protein [Mediterraneibacter faecis]